MRQHRFSQGLLFQRRRVQFEKLSEAFPISKTKIEKVDSARRRSAWKIKWHRWKSGRQLDPMDHSGPISIKFNVFAFRIIDRGSIHMLHCTHLDSFIRMSTLHIWNFRSVQEYIGIWFIAQQWTFYYFLNYSSHTHMEWRMNWGMNLCNDACTKCNTAIACNQLFWPEYCLNFWGSLGIHLLTSVCGLPWTSVAATAKLHQKLQTSSTSHDECSFGKFLGRIFLWNVWISMFIVCNSLNSWQKFISFIYCYLSHGLFFHTVDGWTFVCLFPAILLSTRAGVSLCLFFCCVDFALFSSHSGFIMMANFMVDIYMSFFIFCHV